MRDIKEIEKRYEQQRVAPKGVRLRKWYLLIIVIIVAIITNPSSDKHREAVRDKIYDLTNVTVLAEEVKEMPSEALGDNILDQMIYSSVNSSNYILFSLTKSTWNGETYTVGIGAFTKVFIFDYLDDVLTKKIIGS